MCVIFQLLEVTLKIVSLQDEFGGSLYQYHDFTSGKYSPMAFAHHELSQ